MSADRDHHAYEVARLREACQAAGSVARTAAAAAVTNAQHHLVQVEALLRAQSALLDALSSAVGEPSHPEFR